MFVVIFPLLINISNIIQFEYFMLFINVLKKFIKYCQEKCCLSPICLIRKTSVLCIKNQEEGF